MNEISMEDDFISRDATIETIYFGGGTPSLLSNCEINDILSAIRKQFIVSTDAEITLEANPDDISNTIVKQWMKSGINRLSIGIQSFSDEELIWMNRAHNAHQAAACIDIIQKSGIDNFSVDLIFGGPFLSNEQLMRNIDIITDKNIPHISCYAMTVEEKTALFHQIKTKKSPPVDNEKQAAQFLITMEALTAAGYEHYEISNYAKPGMRSRHNSSYWKNNPYHGFGPAAHAYNGKDERRWNVANNALYISKLTNHESCHETETLSKTQRINEYIMTAIRTIEGINLRHFRSWFGESCCEILITKSHSFTASGNLIQHEDSLQLTTSGKLLADGISSALFFE